MECAVDVRHLLYAHKFAIGPTVAILHIQYQEVEFAVLSW